MRPARPEDARPAAPVPRLPGQGPRTRTGPSDPRRRSSAARGPRRRRRHRAQLLITAGGNPDRLGSEASFAALCGAAPVPASSGKTTRHRLSRGGDRGANYALHVIATVRLSSDTRTKEFAQRQRDKGRSNPEILRLLKRAIAREMHRQLTRPRPATGVADLRDIRRAKNISQRAAAAALEVSEITISRTERGQYLCTDLTTRYREWLNTA